MNSEVTNSVSTNGYINKNDRHFKSQVIESSGPVDIVLRFLLLTIQLVWTQLHLYGRFVLYQWHRFASWYWHDQYLAEIKQFNTEKLINIAIGINHPLDNYDQLAELISWCRALASVRTVAIYHPYGGNDQQVELKRLIPGGSESENFDVCLLSAQSGRQSLIEAARHFAHKPDQPITSERVSEYLLRDYPHPDPQLLLAFGDAHIYNGFPCWQIRLTETVFFPPLEWFTLSQFCRALKLFNACEQRMGK